jgi:NRPS condensation-like uncharacterized protein
MELRRKIRSSQHGEKPDNFNILPAYAHDYGNYAARYGMGNFQIQVVMKLDSRLDFEKLSKAVRLSVDEEPVLGCRFVEHDPPYWKRIEDIDNVQFCTMEETDDSEAAVQRFLESPLDMDKDPMVNVRLIRAGAYDIIGLKINHTCSDGSGTKDYIQLLSKIYSSLDSEKGGYIPTPRIRSRDDHYKILENLGIKHPEFENTPVDAPRTVWPFPWKSSGSRETCNFAISQLPAGKIDDLSRYAKAKGATINDLLITALYRAMFRLSRPPHGIPMDMGVTVDLRRYLPENKAEAIRNLSGGIILRIARKKNETFERTLSRIASAMEHKKTKNPGFQCAVGAERAEKLSFRQFLAVSKFISRLSETASRKCMFCSPGLSNVGFVSRAPIIFGQAAVTEAFFIPPVVCVPSLLFVASSYNGIMTLAAGYYEGSVERSYVEKLLDAMKSELLAII